MTTKYTSYNNNKWGVVTSGKSLQYETKRTHNGLALLVFLVPAVLLVLFIASHM